MRFVLNLTPAARKGIDRIRRSGDRGKLKQVHGALDKLARDPAHPSLQTHRMRVESRFGGRDDLWISYVRTGPGGERVVWSYATGNTVAVLDIEYIGPHVD